MIKTKFIYYIYNKEFKMKNIKKSFTIMSVIGLLALAGCGDTEGTRALTGGAIGAGGGAIIGAATGGNVGTGALVGGLLGAGTGALTTGY
jgi:osmotically inducible lipoprotein OsmB